MINLKKPQDPVRLENQKQARAAIGQYTHWPSQFVLIILAIVGRPVYIALEAAGLPHQYLVAGTMVVGTLLGIVVVVTVRWWWRRRRSDG